MSCEFRSVCSVRSPKEQNKGELTLFHACTRTPAPGKDKCETHLREDVCKEDDSVRKDLGPMTRARAKALGVEEELLSSGAGCRREERISKRKSREVTSGMLFIYRPCGISLGHCEMISAGKGLSRQRISLNFVFDLFRILYNLPRDVVQSLRRSAAEGRPGWSGHRSGVRCSSYGPGKIIYVEGTLFLIPSCLFRSLVGKETRPAGFTQRSCCGLWIPSTLGNTL